MKSHNSRRIQQRQDRRRQREEFVDLRHRIGDHIHPLVVGDGVRARLAVDVIVPVSTQEDVVAAPSQEGIIPVSAVLQTSNGRGLPGNSETVLLA